MEIIVLSNQPGAGCRTCLGPRATLLLGVLLAVALGASAVGGYRLGTAQWGAAEREVLQDRVSHELGSQRRELREARAAAQRNLDALALQLGGMEARLVRLDALGRRLVEMGQLDAAEFGFGDDGLGMGGPQRPAAGLPNTVPDFLEELDALAGRLEDREQRLGALESLLRGRRLIEEASPTGRPLKTSWISSYFGLRKDPITGRRTRHEGVDFAGPSGSDVIAVASGVVVYSGRRPGFGRVVDIDHGNGLVTRYAHNAKNLVAVGEKVEKGQAIALVGSSGRATGPHVHFEVLQNDRPVNPIEFIRSKKG